MANYFRTDGWVKSAQGPAIPGAQIYVCTQPANVASLPPSPLAAIFSDPFGLVPISQPIITDGFGHYDFYTTTGVYTVLVGLGGITQQVYLDQSVGGGTQSGGTALAVQVNGALTTNQLLANFRGAGSVTVSADSIGDITITGASTVLPVFQTNGTANTLQSVLNLKAGTGISLAADGAGGVTFNNAATGLILPFFIGPGITTNPASTTSAAVNPINANNAIQVFSFVLVGSITVSNVSVSFTNGSGGRVAAFGIYSMAGNLLLDSGALSAASAIVVSNTITPVVLPAGTYYFAQTSNSTGTQFQGLSAQAQHFLDMGNVTVDRAALATNTYNGTTLPATLGALSALTVSNYAGIGYPIFS